MAAYIPLEAFKRVPFVEPDGATIIRTGQNFAFGALAMQIRASKGDSGSPLVSLSNAPVGQEGLSASYDPEFLYVDEQGREVTAEATKLLIHISEITLESLSLGTPYAEPVSLYYDIHVTPVGGAKFVLCEGEFILKPGVTI